MSDTPDWVDLPPVPRIETTFRPAATFQGNGYDLAAIVGVTTGIIVLLMCGTGGMGIYCLPIVPIIFGAIGLMTARDSVNPDRTKLLSWLSLGAGGLFLLLILLAVVAYVGLIAFAIASGGNGF